MYKYNIFLRFLLLFKKRKVLKMDSKQFPFRTYTLVYKNLFGKMYPIEFYETPPEHVNCRCLDQN